jgi:hypothetical protein
MKRILFYSALSVLPLVTLLGISSAKAPTTSDSVMSPSTEVTPPSCRRVHGAACRPNGATIRCSIGDPPEIRVCVCEDNAFNCR